MYHRSPLGNVRLTVRARICPNCSHRPAGSEALPCSEARSCEPECTIFAALPRLIEIVHTVHSDGLSPYERATRELVCQSCVSSPTSGDFCSDRSTAHCPLSVYLGDVVDAIERVT